jgi:ABC-2 type transport system permease protein
VCVTTEPKVHKLKKYVRIWWRLAIMSLKTQIVNPISSTGYLFGKLFRLAFFIVFLVAIFHHTDNLSGYTLPQAALFFLTFNMVDILAQLFFRGIYGIRGIVRDGDFDYFLIQPTNLIWRVCFNTVDFLDVATIIPVILVTAWVMGKIPGATTPLALFLYALLLCNGLFIAFALHLVVAGMAVWTQEMDNTIWIYRDLMTLGRFPADIYDRPMQAAITFIVPIAVMISFPAKAAMGILQPRWLFVAIVMAVIALTVSLKFWRFACSRYMSVSS